MDKLLQIVQRLGMNKENATPHTVAGGLTLGVIFMLFVSQHQYERDIDRLEQENSKLWHQVHVMRDAEMKNGIYSPDTDDWTPSTNNAVKNK